MCIEYWPVATISETPARQEKPLLTIASTSNEQ